MANENQGIKISMDRLFNKIAFQALEIDIHKEQIAALVVEKAEMQAILDKQKKQKVPAGNKKSTPAKTS